MTPLQTTENILAEIHRLRMNPESLEQLVDTWTAHIITEQITFNDKADLFAMIRCYLATLYEQPISTEKLSLNLTAMAIAWHELMAK